MMSASVLKFLLLSAIVFPSLPRSFSLPFVVFHGIGGSCKNKGQNFTSYLRTLAGSEGYCLEIGNGRRDSWFMPIAKQVDIACAKVKAMEELKHGFNVVGRSQGALIARAMIQTCDGAPPIKNFISLAGPHAGTTIAPRCKRSRVICRAYRRLIKSWVYSDFLQEHLAPAGYIKLPMHVPEYLKKSCFLPWINNERYSEKSETYKTNLKKLKNLILIMNMKDTVLDPPVTAWFGYYPVGSFNHTMSLQQGQLFKNDRLGLRSLYTNGRVKFFSVPGKHLEMTYEETMEYVVPYLKGVMIGVKAYTLTGAGFL